MAKAPKPGASQFEFHPPKQFDGVTHKDLGDLRERIATLEALVKIGGAILVIAVGIIGWIAVRVAEKVL